MRGASEKQPNCFDLFGEKIGDMHGLFARGTHRTLSPRLCHGNSDTGTLPRERWRFAAHERETRWTARRRSFKQRVSCSGQENWKLSAKTLTPCTPTRQRVMC